MKHPPIFESPPAFSDELVAACQRNNDPMPIVFEWFKYIGILTIQIASIHPSSPAIRSIPPIFASVMRGLTSRCARLALAITNLCHEDKHGESVAILARCISESAIKLAWLCHNQSDTKFRQFIADGLKKDLAFRDVLQKNIDARNGVTLHVESGMLKSIQNCLDASGLQVDGIPAISRMPDLLTICRDIGLSEDFYTAIQRVGSHAIHGTWTDLVLHHLVPIDGCLMPRDHHVRPRAAQLVGIGSILLYGLSKYIELIVADGLLRSELLEFLHDVNDEINVSFDLTNGGNYEPIARSL